VAGANDRGGWQPSFPRLTQRSAAVPAGIVEGTRNVIITADEQERLITKIESAESSSAHQVSGSAHIERISIPNARQFARIVRWIR